MRLTLSTRRSTAITGVSATVVAALIATLAIIAPGFETQRVALDDGSLWVASGERQTVGRANLQIGLLDSVIPSGGSQLEIIQGDEDVIVVDSVRATADLLDVARAGVRESVALPPDQPTVHTVSTSVIVHARGSGETWVLPRLAFSEFDAASRASFVFGSGSALAVENDYGVAVVSPEASEVYRLLPDRSDRVEQTWPLAIEAGADADISIVGDQWVVLDRDQRALLTADSTISFSELVAPGSALQLALPRAGSSEVLLAHEGGLLSVSLETGEARALVDDRSGIPAAPVIVDDCSFAAWTDGTAWRQCGTSTETLALEAVTASAALRFAVREDRTVLNDATSGSAWAVQSDGALIDNWDDLIREDDDEREEQLDDLDVPPELERAQAPPIAVDDEFGARPGRSTVVPVLLNDSDPNGDVLVISEFTPVDSAIGRLDLISNAQQLQLTLEPSAAGQIEFAYTITDGRGGSDSARVTVTVRSPSENSPPVQVRTSRTTVAEGGTTTTAVLGEWFDPDGDPIFVESAVAIAPDTAAFRPDGRVTFSEAGGAGEVRTVALTVSDGTASTIGQLAVTVRLVSQVPIIAEPFIVLAYADQEVRIDPLVHVRGGSGTIRLSAVPEKAGATITPSLERGSFRFQSTEVRTHYLEYVVTDGQTTATGLVRVDVAVPPESGSAPITVPKTAFVRTLSNATVAVATTDIDPAGGVLVVTGIADVPSGSGIRAEVIEQRDVRVTLTRPLDAPQSIRYRISNGAAESVGTITVIEIPRPDRQQPPIAVDDSISVRIGDAVTVPVLDNDEHPDGEPITLAPDLVSGLEGESGLLFVAGDRLRYLAPNQPGDFTAVYEILGPLGQERAQATVSIRVREANEATNQPPVTRTVTARVIAGDTVRIRIPVETMDPDGDSVQLIGPETSPERGSIVDSGQDYIDYEAGSYSAGTDTFRYTVVDALGARASGEIRVGISPRLEGARNPVANDDQVVVRPGVTVLVPVLDNDSDPDGAPLTVTGVEPNDSEITAQVVEGRFVRVTPPSAPGQYGLVYSIENQIAGTSQAFITITVDPDAPLTPPVARDTVLSLPDILEQDSLAVDVLARVFFSEGEVAQLGLQLVPGYESGAVIEPDQRIRVEVGAERQIIPFQVLHPDDPSVRSTAFLWVPGTDDALPQLDRRAPRIQVVSEETVLIDINDYVIAVGGAPVRLTDTATVQAARSTGQNPVVDETTLRFTSSDLYFGPASLSFEVTDGDSATDPEGRVATIVLPITVTPRENQPPVLVGASLELEPGQSRELDLVRVTSYPYPDDLDELAYEITDGPTPGLVAELDGQQLRVSVSASTPRGSTTGLTLSVRDDAAPGTPGRIQVSVVPSTRPLAAPAADNAIAPRGETTIVDVLANDQATNPFPRQPLRVVGVRGLDGGIPSGVSIAPVDGGQRLAVTVSDSAAPVDTNLEYQVADVTDDPERYVWGTVRISVQDVPDPVTNLRVQSYGDRELTLAWSPGASNNAPIERFDAVVTTVESGSSTTITCSSSPCTVPTTGNGPENRVRVSVSAVNAQGASSATTLGEATWSDLVPPAPPLLGALPLDGGLRIGWTKPAQESAASPIRSYRITVGSVTRTQTVPASDPVGTEYWINVVDAGALANGTSYSLSVSARNDAFGALTTWNAAQTTGTPAGPPVVAGAPTASGSTSGAGTDDREVTVSWPGAFTGNGRSVQTYYVWLDDGGSAPACTGSGVSAGEPEHTPPPGVRTLPATASSTVFTGLSADTTYRAVVFAYNGQGCTASVEVTAVPRATPTQVTAVTVTSGVETETGRWNSVVTGVTTAGGDAVDRVRYRLIGAGVDPGESSRLALPVPLTAGGSHYGAALEVQVQACRDYPEISLCGEWSEALPIAVAVRIDSAVEFTDISTDPSDRSVQVDWSAISAGAAYTAVQYECGGGDVVTDPDAPQQCSIIATAPDDPRLVITVTVGETTYTREYRP